MQIPASWVGVGPELLRLLLGDRTLSAEALIGGLVQSPETDSRILIYKK